MPFALLKGADEQILTGNVWQQDGAYFAVHHFTRTLEDMIDEFDQIVRAAKPPRHFEQNALA